MNGFVKCQKCGFEVPTTAIRPATCTIRKKDPRTGQVQTTTKRVLVCSACARAIAEKQATSN